MAFLNRAERHDANAFARIGYCNPFLPQRLQLERQILGDRFQSGAPVIHFPSDLQSQEVFKNFSLLLVQSKLLADKMRQRVLAGKCQREEDQQLYRETVVFLLYGKHFSINEVPFVRRPKNRTRSLASPGHSFKKTMNGI